MTATQDTQELRCLVPTFDGASIVLSYAAYGAADEPTTVFREVIELPSAIEVDDAVRGLAQLLSMAASLSYYKALLPGRLTTEFAATPEEQTFFAELTANGLAEFAYRNDLPDSLTPEFAFGSRDLDGRSFHSLLDQPGGRFVEQAAEGPSVETPQPRFIEQAAERPSVETHSARALVAVGGGKDSIVTIEALRAIGREVTLFSVNDYAPIAATADRSGLPRLVATRKLDSQLFALNEAGAPNGHVPVTAINSIIALLVAHQQGIGDVVFSNEASSSYGNLTWHDRVVNHQWSKGIQAERLLHDLASAYRVNYVSLLRPLSELAIMRRFAHHEKYFDVFTSCNRAFKLDASKRTAWCGECDKCRFVYLCLAPFVSRAQLEEIFGKDLLADESQREGFLELLNVDDRVKPFECVGEPSECRVALDLLRESRGWTGHPFFVVPEVVRTVSEPSDREWAFAWREEHLLDGDLEKAARAIL